LRCPRVPLDVAFAFPDVAFPPRATTSRLFLRPPVPIPRARTVTDADARAETSIILLGHLDAFKFQSTTTDDDAPPRAIFRRRRARERASKISCNARARRECVSRGRAPRDGAHIVNGRS